MSRVVSISIMVASQEDQPGPNMLSLLDTVEAMAAEYNLVRLVRGIDDLNDDSILIMGGRAGTLEMRVSTKDV